MSNARRAPRLLASFGGQIFAAGSYVVWMDQPHRGLAEMALGIGDDVSSRISTLDAPPGAGATATSGARASRRLRAAPRSIPRPSRSRRRSP